MLSSIHPFGERSRNNSFGRTATAHVLGGTAGGAVLGVLAGALGIAINAALAPSDTVRTAIVLAAAVVALALEATSRERMLPTRTRQVNENWIQTYRGWVYAGGFGAELGFGISTIITTTLVHLTVIAMVLVGSFPLAVLIGAIFGLVRGATVLTARKVDSPESLRHFHQRLDQLRSRSRSGAVATLTAANIIGVVGVVL